MGHLRGGTRSSQLRNCHKEEEGSGRKKRGIVGREWEEEEGNRMKGVGGRREE